MCSKEAPSLNKPANVLWIKKQQHKKLKGALLKAWLLQYALSYTRGKIICRQSSRRIWRSFWLKPRNADTQAEIYSLLGLGPWPKRLRHRLKKRNLASKRQ